MSGDLDRRRAFAESLDGYRDQRLWYSERASTLKRRAQRTDLAILVAGTLVAAIPAAGGPRWLLFVVSGLGIAITVLKGTARILRDGEIWPEYRIASEAMKRETRLFTHAIGPYAGDTEAAERAYVTALEAIIAGEQVKFFEGLAPPPAERAGPPAEKPGGKPAETPASSPS